MNRRPRRRAAALALAGFAAFALALTGCEENTVPVITKLSATPQCGSIEDIPPGQFGNTSPDTLRYLLVTFFGRASSGNSVSDPTGANSPLEWRWDFNGDGIVDATNIVNPSYRYEQPGDYVARLEVEDDDGDKIAKTIVVQVREESSELDTLELEATFQSDLRLTQLPPVNTGVDSEGEPIPIEDLPLDERFVFDSQYRFDGWAAIFDGKLALGCTVAELFSQFDWVWELSTGSTVVDLNPLSISRGTTDYTEITGRVTVSELVTGVSRSDTTVAAHPTGVIVNNGQYYTIAPGAATEVPIRGLMLRGITELDFGVEYDVAELTAESWNTDYDLPAAGFTVTVTPDPGAGRIDFSYRSDTPLSTTAPELLLATVTFRAADVTLSSPALRPMRVRDMVAIRNGVNPPLQFRDGFIRADVDDCNDNELGDTMELEARGTFIDITADGVVDYCADCDASGAKDGEEILASPLTDIDSNGLPDPCDCNSNGAYDAGELSRGAPDADSNGQPDDCDCDWNGSTDLVEILEHPSFAPQFDPVNGLVVSYTSSLDQLGGGADLELDFCQDCDEDLTFDSVQTEILIGDSEETILAKFKLDVDSNDKLDSCDCDLDTRYDRGQLERQTRSLGPIVDADGDGVIDACDCDESGELDILEVSAGILSYDDLEATPRPGGATLITGYRSNVDVNGDFVLDRCADCDENGLRDGIDIAQELRLDIDVNGMPDRCDCNSDDEYDPIPAPEQDRNGDGIPDACDCDDDGLNDLEKIAFDPSTQLILEGDRVVGYTSTVDAVQVGDGGAMVAGDDLRLDLCQDCDANGVADAQENNALVDARLPRDLDRNGKLDACDCNGDRRYDVIEIAETPSLDGDGDGLVDACDCNDNGQNDLLELGAVAEFDPDLKVYTGSDLDLNLNLILDECEGAANRVPAPGPERAARR